jgi:hypothetical protein
MKNKIAVKITLKSTDPFDSEIIQALEREKNKAAFIRKAVFCYIKGPGAQPAAASQPRTKTTEKDKDLNNKLSKLMDL